MMKILARNFAGEVTAEKCGLYHAALADVSDEQLDAAVVRIIKTHRGEFVPPVAVVRDAAGANQAPAIEVSVLTQRIRELGLYYADIGRWYAPSAERVGAALGASVARAYGVAGAGLLFSDSDTTREIAERDFGRALAYEVQVHGHDALAPREIAARETPRLSATHEEQGELAEGRPEATP